MTLNTLSLSFSAIICNSQNRKNIKKENTVKFHKKWFQQQKSSKILLLSTGIFLGLFASALPLSVKADDDSATLAASVQTNKPDKTTESTLSAASDLATHGKTENAQIQMVPAPLSSSQTTLNTNLSKESSSLTSSASSPSSVSSSPISSANTTDRTSGLDLAPSSTSSNAPTFPLDSSHPAVTVASSLSATGTVTNPALTNGEISSQANHQDPSISSISATGSVANDITGPATLDDINITIKANNLVPNNFVTPDGLHWSDKTQVIPIKGQTTGQISAANFGQTDGPTIPATTYTMNPGDSGRIINIGTTLAGTNLDLIYKVISTDASTWQGGTSDCPIGLAFTGEQKIANSDGNSIVALYYGANHVDLNYQIVAHDTDIPTPVLASFITTDVDVAQGVKTNLANLLTVIPKTTNLATDSTGVIYDTTPSDTDLNGQASLPYGGYLGVGFLSNFDYDFYSPSPARSGNSYQYSQGVRYDLFGSALQAHLTTQVRDVVYLNYYDADENNQLIVPQHQFIWFPNVSWTVPASKFPHYAYGQETQHRNGNTITVGDYYHIQSTVTYDYYGTDGVYLGQESTTGLYGHAYSVNVPYNFGNYYIEGSTTRSGLYPKHDETLDVYYKYVPPIVYYNTSNPYATTYYANGYEYVPNYIAPVVYYVSTYGYDGDYSSDSGNSDGDYNSANNVAQSQSPQQNNNKNSSVNSQKYSRKSNKTRATHGSSALKGILSTIVGDITSKLGTWGIMAERATSKEISDTIFGTVFDAFLQFSTNNPSIAALKTAVHLGITILVNILVDLLSFGAAFLLGWVIAYFLDTLADWAIDKWVR